MGDKQKYYGGVFSLSFVGGTYSGVSIDIRGIDGARLSGLITSDTSVGWHTYTFIITAKSFYGNVSAEDVKRVLSEISELSISVTGQAHISFGVDNVTMSPPVKADQVGWQEQVFSSQSDTAEHGSHLSHSLIGYTAANALDHAIFALA